MMLRSLLYIIAVVLTLGWLLGFFYFKDTGLLLHVLLVMAVTALVLALFRKDNQE
ncbi:MAG: lmo0937 family membrane protein [Chitinophagia bacterium]|nr:lmo0937 family membrane protein [Chitinophagia bacterium]